MNRRIALTIGIFSLLGVIASVMWLRSAAVAPPERVESGPDSSSAPVNLDDQAAIAVDDARRARLAAAFAGLQASRKALQYQLGHLKSILWGRELPADQARRISRDMMSAQYRLKNPALLGAFSDANEIFAEQDRVDAARIQLQEISRTVGKPATP